MRNLRVKYQRSVLGFVWTLLNPLITILVLVAVFSKVVDLRVPHYWAFLLSGYFVWTYTSQNLMGASFLVASHASLRASVAFPHEVLVLSAAATRLVEFAIEFALVLVALVLFHHHGVPLSFVLVPVLIVLLVIVVLGLTLPIATLAVFYADIQHVLPPLLLTLFWVTPVFYPLARVPGTLRDLYFLNPLTPLLTLYHVVLYEGRMPPLELLGTTAAVGCVLCIVGYALFNRFKGHFAEIL